MPLKKILFRPGVNRENTRYASESLGSVNTGTQSVGGWYESNNVRFRQGTPEKIGGWVPDSIIPFLGICRSLWNWVTLGALNLLGVGTNLKFYIQRRGGGYSDITPIRATTTLGTDPFTANGTTTVTVAATAHGGATGDFVTFSGATGTYATTLNAEFQITVVNANSYTITTGSALTAGSYGGSAVVAAYQISIGPAVQIPTIGWGAGGWGNGTWGNGETSLSKMRLWSQINWGEDLIFGPRGGAIYYWDATNGVSTRGVLMSSLAGTVTITIASPAVITLSSLLAEGTAIKLATTGALPTGLTAGTTYYLRNVDGVTANLAAARTGGSVINTSGTQSGVQSISDVVDVPTLQNYISVSDVNRFVFAFGCNDIDSAVQDPMLIRWSSRESVVDWFPSTLNTAGFTRLSHGSEIVTCVQTRQEIVVFTDSALYSLQFLEGALTWGTQLLGDNISIIGQNSAIVASGVIYWMGVDKFYKYDGRLQTLRCDLRQYIYSNINLEQADQVFAGTSEGFNEVWWFYCTQYEDDGVTKNTTINRYVVYNYAEDIWYYGTMGRTAWLDSGLRDTPIAATYANTLVNHESGTDDNVNGTAVAMSTIISSSEFDIDDGHNFGFVWRILPDLTFRGSSDSVTPQVTMTLIPLQNSGSGYNDPQSEGSTSYATVQRITRVPVEEFTGQVYVRVRGRQMVFRVENAQLGSQWQLGAPRIDIRADGRRGNT